MQIDKHRLAEIIKLQREVKGLTQTELSEKSGISLRSIQRIEKREVLPRSYTIKALGMILDFGIEDLTIPEHEEHKPDSSKSSKKVILSLSSGLIIFLLALAFLYQSPTFPESTFELTIFWIVMLIVITIFQWIIWVGKKF